MRTLIPALFALALGLVLAQDTRTVEAQGAKGEFPVLICDFGCEFKRPEIRHIILSREFRDGGRR